MVEGLLEKDYQCGDGKQMATRLPAHIGPKAEVPYRRNEMAEKPKGSTKRGRSTSQKAKSQKPIEDTTAELIGLNEERGHPEGIEKVAAMTEPKVVEMPQEEATTNAADAEVPQEAVTFQEREGPSTPVLQQLMEEPTFRKRVIARLVKKLG